ncbi:MAG: galactose mutarotase [Calditrichaceae bacterium]|nr:galactose mutarotase [Calditrichaceae bacterium]
MKSLCSILVLSVICLVIISCNDSCNSGMTVTKEIFGQLDGRDVEIYTITNPGKAEMKVTTYGGIITSFKLPDKNGILSDVVLGYDNLDGYVKNNPYFGATIGRYGNRIGNAKFTLDGNEYSLAHNDGPNSLHGGVKGFDKVVWNAQPFSGSDSAGLILKYLSKDGEEGFPGNLDVTVTYTLTKDNTFRIDYQAATDKPTICNLTNHTYWNFKDAGKSDILQHELMLNASNYTPVDKTLIPTGVIEPVKDTPMDFTAAHAIGDNINADYEQLKIAGGYDHNWKLDNPANVKMNLAATVYEPTTGRFMEILTEEPGIQFYSGNFLDGSITGKNGDVYKFRSGFCLETQHYPDSPNKPEFPSVVLRPGEVYKTTTIHKFSIK